MKEVNIQVETTKTDVTIEVNQGIIGPEGIQGLQGIQGEQGPQGIQGSPGVFSNHSELTLDDGTNPHGTTASDVGLGNVDNTSDANKPISTATQTAIDGKVTSVIAGTNITVDATDPNNPIVSSLDRENNIGNVVGATLTLDLTAYETFTAVLTEATTIAISNPIIKAVTLDVSGNFALSYPAGAVVVGDTYDGTVAAKVVIEHKPSITFITVTNYA